MNVQDKLSKGVKYDNSDKRNTYTYAKDIVITASRQETLVT